MSKNSISYIMPAYNAARTIKESVDSIIAGNFGLGDELVIVDDCSSDSTSDVLKKLQKDYGNKIKIVRHKYNRGGGAARNTAVSESGNSLIFCLDSDNILETDSVAKLKDWLLKTKSDVASFETLKYFKTSTDNVTHEWKFLQKNASFEGALSAIQFPGASGNYLFTKDSWVKSGGYPEFAGALDAWGFGFRQVATGSKMTVLPKSFYYHRYGHESYWVRESKNGQTSIRALQIVLPYIDKLNDADVDYMMSRAGRHVWLENREKRPIRLKDRVRNTNGIFSTIKNRVRR